MRGRSSRITPFALLAPAVVAALLGLAPLVYIAVRATEQGWEPVRAELFNRRTAALALRSLRLAAAVVCSCAVLGTASAWLVARTTLPGRRLLTVLLAAPLAIPTYVAAYAWLAQTGLSGFRGAFLVLTACCYPYVFLPVLGAMAGLDRRQEDVARSLGAAPLTVFLRVTLPQLRAPIATASLLVATYVLSDFGAVSLMRYEAFTQAIFLSYKGSFDRTPAAILGCLLVAITAIVVVVEGMVRGRSPAARSARGADRPVAPVALGWGTVPALGAVIAVVGVSVFAPLGILVRWAFSGASDSVAWSEVWSTAWATAEVSVAGAVLTLALALPLGIAAARHRTPFVRVLESSSYVGHSLPGLVIGLSLVFFGVRYANPIYQRTPLLLVAYAVLFLPLAVAAVRSSVAQTPVVLDEVARTLGARPMTAVRRVVLPLAAPGVAAGGAMVMLTCVKELPATLLLRPTGLDTLATRLWTETSVSDYGRAAPYALAIVALATIPTLLLTRPTQQLRPRIRE